MTTIITWEIPETWTERTLAAFIADLIETDDRWWHQGTWFGDALSFYDDEEGAPRFRRGEQRITVDAVRAQLAGGEWTCGTTGCVAGWVAILTAPEGAVIDAHSDELFTVTGEVHGEAKVIAKRELGLTAGQADWLFDSHRTKEEVLTSLTLIATGSGCDVPSDEDYDDEDCDEYPDI